MSKTIGGNSGHRGKQCLNCGEPFEWTEFSSFFLKLRGNTLSCVRCLTENYFVANRNGVYWALALFSIILGFAIFIIVAVILSFLMTYNDIDGTFGIPIYMIIAGGFLGLATIRLCMKLLLWKTGTLSLDRAAKSMADYE